MATPYFLQVNFSEPLSMLQRLAEDFEYSHILDRAALCTDSTEQMCFVAAFTVSSYATTRERTGKPFNPLLGETFECDRMDDLGWRAIAEQVRQAKVSSRLGNHKDFWFFFRSVIIHRPPLCIRKENWDGRVGKNSPCRRNFEANTYRSFRSVFRIWSSKSESIFP